MTKWRLNTNLKGFTVGKVYDEHASNSFNVALKNDDGDIEYVQKRFLDEVGFGIIQGDL